MRFPTHYFQYMLLPLLAFPLISANPKCKPVSFNDPHHPVRRPFNAADCAFIINHFPTNGILHHTTHQMLSIPIRTPVQLIHGSCEITVIPHDSLEMDYPKPPYGSDLHPEWWEMARNMAQEIVLLCSARQLGGSNNRQMNYGWTINLKVRVHQWKPWGGERYWV